jgi:hypothetical protein
MTDEKVSGSSDEQPEYTPPRLVRLGCLAEFTQTRQLGRPEDMVMGGMIPT